MIKEIRLIHFYSFDDTVISLHPETNILIGINGSGKSNFLKALKLLHEGVAGIGLKKHILENLGGFDNFFFKLVSLDQPEKQVSIEFIFDSNVITKGGYGFRFTDDIIYQIIIRKQPSQSNFYIQEKISTHKGFVYLDFKNGVGYLNEKVASESNKTSLVKYSDFDPQELGLKEVSDSDRYIALTTLKKAIKDIAVYDYFDLSTKSGIRKPVLPTSDKRLSSDGGNLAQILNTIKINYKEQYRKIVTMLKEVNPQFTGFDFNHIGGNIELMLEENGLDSSVHVSNISDGTLQYLCLLAILYNPDRGKFICIDEPEAGLHPDMILNIANAIKEAAEFSTIIVSTHSENLLNYFEIANVKVFEKNAQNATKVISFTKDQFADWYDAYSLGNMWKQGDLGGVRYGG